MSKKNQEQSLPAMPEAPVVTPPERAGVSAVKKIQDIIRTLSREDQEELARMGTVLPAGDISAAIEGRFRFGLRCTKCNDIALFFVGTEFIDLNNGEQFDEPKPHMTIQQLPWTQRLPADQINRSDPKCQNCGVEVAKEGENCFRFSRTGGSPLLVVVDEFTAARDASYSRKSLQDLRRKMDGTGDSVAVAGGGSVQLKDSIDRTRFEDFSKKLQRDNPQAFELMSQLDKELAPAGGLLGALASEGRGR